MPSHRYISTRRGHVNISGMHIGGAVPILRHSVHKYPVTKGGEVGSNKIVGLVTPQADPVILEGGKLLKHINFGHAPKNDSQRIKFIF